MSEPHVILSHAGAGRATPACDPGRTFRLQRSAVVLVTVLGSCVAACIRDPSPGSRMNHFLLPGASENRRVGISHGVHAMELLVNDLLRHGARRDGWKPSCSAARDGRGPDRCRGPERRVRRALLKDEGIPCLRAACAASMARRVQFWPASGRGRQLLLGVNAEVFDSERTPAAAPSPAPQDSGALELF